MIVSSTSLSSFEICGVSKRDGDLDNIDLAKEGSVQNLAIVLEKEGERLRVLARVEYVLQRLRRDVHDRLHKVLRA